MLDDAQMASMERVSTTFVEQMTQFLGSASADAQRQLQSAVREALIGYALQAAVARRGAA